MDGHSVNILLTGTKCSGKSSFARLITEYILPNSQIDLNLRVLSPEDAIHHAQTTPEPIHLCLFLLPPCDLHPTISNSALGSLTALSKLAPLLPILSKSDTYTSQALRGTKSVVDDLIHQRGIRSILGYHGAEVWSIVSPEWRELDASTSASSRKTRSPGGTSTGLSQLASLCSQKVEERQRSSSLDSMSAKPSFDLFVREYPWGTCHILDPVHSDVSIIKDWIIDSSRVLLSLASTESLSHNQPLPPTPHSPHSDKEAVRRNSSISRRWPGAPASSTGKGDYDYPCSHPRDGILPVVRVRAQQSSSSRPPRKASPESQRSVSPNDSMDGGYEGSVQRGGNGDSEMREDSPSIEEAHGRRRESPPESGPKESTTKTQAIKPIELSPRSNILSHSYVPHHQHPRSTSPTSNIPYHYVPSPKSVPPSAAPTPLTSSLPTHLPPVPSMTTQHQHHANMPPRSHRRHHDAEDAPSVTSSHPSTNGSTTLVPTQYSGSVSESSRTHRKRPSTSSMMSEATSTSMTTPMSVPSSIPSRPVQSNSIPHQGMHHHQTVNVHPQHVPSQTKPRSSANHAPEKAKGPRSGPKVVACNYCRARKTRCDGQQPACGNCVKRRLGCNYVVSQREAARRKRASIAEAAAQMSASTSSHLGVLQVKDVVLGEFRGNMDSSRGGYARLTTADSASAPTSPAVPPSLEHSHSAGATATHQPRRLHDSSPFSPVGQPLPRPPSTHQQHARLPPMSKDGPVNNQGRFHSEIDASPRLPPIATLVNSHPHPHHHGAAGVTPKIARLSLSPTEGQNHHSAHHHEHSQHPKQFQSQHHQTHYSPPSLQRDMQGSPVDQNRYPGLGKREREPVGMSRSVSLNGISAVSSHPSPTGVNGPQSKRMRVDELVSRTSSNDQRNW
ncbi:hypothetical protein SISNIDRAFT_454153 [Sistotremastrum niveocremeum HHB9708]|uniref:Zn(2)-C6 fungal-type domain-containing protein n=1 Tax=Sistotremastrum niveocremeum HHB9708 TaxID=1314777 RepID=A0A164V1M7_9AGAM|nr:hypothetical protein SISNIDRAFT_454153 [Sistotremastrum niveocremeum HHB9708]